MTADESAELVEVAARSGLVNAVNFNIRFYPLHQHVREIVAAGELGDVRLVTGHYFQDWLLLETDWNWRLEPDKGGSLRAVGDIGSHWLDLVTFLTGQQIVAVMADLATFVTLRKQPQGPVETFSTERSADTVGREMATEDVASILLRFGNGARGAVSVSQISAGRKNSLQWEIDGSTSAAAWDSETPDHLWLGHRDRPNELLLRNPALMGPAGRAASALPAGHVEGFADTFGALFRAIYADVARGAPSPRPPYATFADGHDEMLVGDAVAESARLGRWVAVDRTAPVAVRPGGPGSMRLGLLTAPFPETPLSDVADWTAANGFESIEIACWPPLDRPEPALRRHEPHRRRQSLGERGRRSLAAAIPAARPRRSPGSGYYPNPLHPDPAHREMVIGHLKHVITAAEKMDVPFVNTFMGGDAAKTQEQNWEEALRVWPDIVAFAERPRPEDHVRELPDAVQLRRMAGRAQYRDHAAHVAARILEQWAGSGRAELRPIAPDPADDRHPAVHSRSSGRTSSTSRRRTSWSTARACTSAACSRWAWAGRSRASRDSATSTGARSSAPCGERATTAT